MTRMRPARPLAPIAVSAFVLFIWWVVAHNSGSGWVQFLGDAVFGTIAVGIFGPAIALYRARLQVVTAPADCTAGLPVPVQIRASTRVRLRAIKPPGPEVFVGPTGARVDDQELILLPAKRGFHQHLLLEVATAAPFGLQWWSRKVTLTLRVGLHVAPRLGEPERLPQLDISDAGDRNTPTPAQVGDTRGVRPYQSGDQRRRVHWPSTAHAARLMVREMEQPSAQPLTLRVALPIDEEAAERAAERAFGTAARILDNGARLLMATDEVAGPITALVTDRLEAGRRLARAVSGRGHTSIEVS
jgi:uncharacterized protein (DUF58 family)